jgi:carbon storage regulator CsrA
MLVLSRKTNESVVITTPSGERIEVTVIEYHSTGFAPKLRLGFKAPKDVKIYRKELLEDKK